MHGQPQLLSLATVVYVVILAESLDRVALRIDDLRLAAVRDLIVLDEDVTCRWWGLFALLVSGAHFARLWHSTDDWLHVDATLGEFTLQSVLSSCVFTATYTVG